VPQAGPLLQRGERADASRPTYTRTGAGKSLKAFLPTVFALCFGCASHPPPASSTDPTPAPPATAALPAPVNSTTTDLPFAVRPRSAAGEPCSDSPLSGEPCVSGLHCCRAWVKDRGYDDLCMETCPAPPPDGVATHEGETCGSPSYYQTTIGARPPTVVCAAGLTCCHHEPFDECQAKCAALSGEGCRSQAQCAAGLSCCPLPPWSRNP
jgi:hypothetical protein